MPGTFEKIFYDEELLKSSGPGGKFRKTAETERSKINEKEEPIERLIKGMKNSENRKILDKLFSENAVNDITAKIENLKNLLEKTGQFNKNDASGKEILRNIEMGLMGILARASKKGLNADYENVIKDEFYKLAEFVEMSLECKEFRDKEFNTEGGYLTEGDIEESGAAWRSDIGRYINMCKESLKKRDN